MGHHPPRLYDLIGPDELLCRPIEHVLEALSCRQLAQALGVTPARALAFREAPWQFTDTDLDLALATPKLRKWLEHQCQSTA